MHQPTFAEAEYATKKHKTRRERMLERLEAQVPWGKLEQQLAKKYRKSTAGPKGYPLSSMLRVHVMQLVYNLSDPGMEDELYEIESMRRFAGLRLSTGIPDETTILNFRRFLETNKFGSKLFDTIKDHLAQQGLMLKQGTIIDATIIEAPTSTKNQSGERDLEMHQVKKGNEWHFGMKMHIGVDDAHGLIHSLCTTPANAHDITQADKLLHGKEKTAWLDAGYTGIEKRPEHCGRDIDWQVAMRPGKRAQLNSSSCAGKLEKLKASVRAKVEHPFRFIKRVFGYHKVRYRGLYKNTERLHILAGLTNLFIAEKYMIT